MISDEIVNRLLRLFYKKPVLWVGDNFNDGVLKLTVIYEGKKKKHKIFREKVAYFLTSEKDVLLAVINLVSREEFIVN